MGFVQRPSSIARRFEDVTNLDKAKQKVYPVKHSRYGLKPTTMFVTLITTRIVNSRIPILNKIIISALGNFTHKF